jgi:hypothetical protein
LTQPVAAVAVPAFALAWWLGAYLVGRDPARAVLWRAAGALWAYGAGIVAWMISPGSSVAEVLFCVPALLWAGVATSLLPQEAPERRVAERGWAGSLVIFLAPAVLLPGVGKLIALAPLAGGLALLLRYRDRVRPKHLPTALLAAAALYVVGLVAVLAPIDLGAPELVLATMAVDVALLGFLVAVQDAVEAGERLLPDLRRSLVAAVAAVLLCGGPAAVTMLATPGLTAVIVLQFVLVGVVLGAVGAAAPLRALLDRLAFLQNGRLRRDRAALLLAADALPRRRERHRMIAMDEPEFRRLTLRALEDYGDLGRLLRNPLVDLPTVDRRLQARGPGLTDQPLIRAAELRAVLSEQVERLRPAGVPGTSQEWRFYNALHYCSVLGVRPYDRVPQTDGMDLDGRRIIDWFRRQVRRESLDQWKVQGAELISGRLWQELLSTDPRWLTRSEPLTQATRGTNGR